MHYRGPASITATALLSHARTCCIAWIGIPTRSCRSIRRFQASTTTSTRHPVATGTIKDRALAMVSSAATDGGGAASIVESTTKAPANVMTSLISMLSGTRKGGAVSGDGFKQSKQEQSSAGKAPSYMPSLSERELHPTVGEFPVDYSMHATNRCGSLCCG